MVINKKYKSSKEVRVAIYVRLSDEDKDKRNRFDPSVSIKNQIVLATSFAEEKGWAVSKVFCDDDFSGVYEEEYRPQFKELLSECEKGLYDVVLCKSMSRFARNIEITERYIENKFVEWGVRFIGLTDNIDTYDLANKKSRQINSLVYQWYSESISNDIRSVFNTKRLNGEYIGSFAVYGYEKSKEDKNKLVIDRDAARVIKRIYELYLQGNGTAKIAQILNDEKVPNPAKYKELKGLGYKNPFDKIKSGLWNKTSVKRILKNQMYIGNMVQHVKEKIHFKTRKTRTVPQDEWIIVEGTHEPIIDKDTFHKVQQLLSSKVRSMGKGNPHIFAGKVRCLDCQSTLSKFSNGVHHYLGCSAYRTDKSQCSKHSIRLDKLTETVEDKIRKHIKRILEDRDQFVEKLMKSDGFKSNIRYYEEKLKKIQAQIAEVDNGFKSLYIDKSKGQLTEDLFEELKTNFVKEREKLKENLSLYQKKIEETKGLKDRRFYWYEKVEKYGDFLELNRRLVNELIDFIEVGEKQDGLQEIVVHYNFSKVY
ncbi:DNA invertase Pin-like site-specific DNA recombinase [Desulfitispora alkaliphila]|uniref:recombinase family protein n=1 Tax=Desulfitispora alkaliphila TaxID=622674 RepID=UPI003D1F4143